MPTKQTNLLLILDGWGHRDDTRDNAIANANTPVWDHLMQAHPHTLVSTSGLDVGLPEGQMGNSEVGHMSLGSGRIVYQNITRINKAISDGDFFTNSAYNNAIKQTVDHNKTLHIIGLLSPGGVHSHQNHIFTMIESAAKQGARRIQVHAILDGRDTPPQSAEAYLSELQVCCDKHGAVIGSMVGRFYAMDRDERWDRIEKAYNLIAMQTAEHQAETAAEALSKAYAREENDEFVSPTTLSGGQPIEAGDALIFMNFRADRARELTQSFTDPDFSGFDRKITPALSAFVMTTPYDKTLKADCAFPQEPLTNSLGEYLSALGKTQLRIAETEKYAHVTFFFSGGQEAEYTGEDRKLIPSPKVKTYDLQPEMSVFEVTDALVNAIHNGAYDTIICNIANGDMVGHTGIYEAAVKACEAVDQSLGKITSAILETNGHCLITADHGNCEQMIDYETNQPHTQHTTGQVPLVYVGNTPRTFLNEPGRLADIAPTLLSLMHLDVPDEMTGHSLFKDACQ